MKLCNHTNTIVNSWESGYNISCLDCEKVWDEGQAEDLENERYLINYYSV